MKLVAQATRRPEKMKTHFLLVDEPAGMVKIVGAEDVIVLSLEFALWFAEQSLSTKKQITCKGCHRRKQCKGLCFWAHFSE